MNRISLFAATAAAIALVLAGCNSGPGPDGMKPEDTAPSFTEMAADQTYTVGEAVSWMLPAATGGNGVLTYSLEGTVPGLQFDPGSRTLSGRPTTAGSYDMTYAVEDGDENTDAGDIATQSFTITVEEAPPADTAPRFTEMAADQTYTVGEAVSWMLPAATGGNGMLTYSLEGTVPGLQFDPGSRTLSGTPTTAGRYDMTYTVEDGDENTDAGDTATQSFTITVQEPEPPAMADYVGTWYFTVPVTTILVLGEDTFTLTVGDGSPIGETPPLNAVTRIAVEGTVAVSDITATTVTMELGPETVTIEPAPQPPLITEPFIINAAAGKVVANIDGDRMSVSGHVVAGIQLLLGLPLDVDLTACRDAPCMSS